MQIQFSRANRHRHSSIVDRDALSHCVVICDYSFFLSKLCEFQQVGTSKLGWVMKKIHILFPKTIHPNLHSKRRGNERQKKSSTFLCFSLALCNMEYCFANVCAVDYNYCAEMVANRDGCDEWWKKIDGNAETAKLKTEKKTRLKLVGLYVFLCFYNCVKCVSMEHRRCRVSSQLRNSELKQWEWRQWQLLVVEI
jgi:hypothetical protein